MLTDITDHVVICVIQGFEHAEVDQPVNGVNFPFLGTFSGCLPRISPLVLK